MSDGGFRCDFRLGCALGLVLATTSLWARYLVFGYVDEDLEFVIWVARRCSLGDVLYVDVIDHRFPLIYQWLSLVWNLFGSYEACVLSILCIDTVSIVYATGILCANRSSGSCALRVGAMSALVSGCHAGHCEVMFIGALALAGDVCARLVRGERVSWGTWVAGGAVMGAAALVKPTICVMCAILVVIGLVCTGQWGRFAAASAIAIAMFALDMWLTVRTSGLDAVSRWLLSGNGGYAHDSVSLWMSGIMPTSLARALVCVSIFAVWFHTLYAHVHDRRIIVCILLGIVALCMSLLRPWPSYMLMSIAALCATDSYEVGESLAVSALAFGLAFGCASAIAGSRTPDTARIHEIVGDSRSVAPAYFSGSVALMRELGLESPYDLPFLCSVGIDEWDRTWVEDVRHGRWQYLVISEKERDVFESILGHYDVVDVTDGRVVLESSGGCPCDLIECEPYEEPKALLPL